MSEGKHGAKDWAADRELERFGYTPQLDRTMGGFSSFAVSFSLISITTGILANFGVGIRAAGAAVLWTWTIAAIGQTLVGMVIADLGGRYPISGYGYQWTSRLVNPHFGFLVGWMLLMQFLSGFPAISNTFSEYLHKYLIDTRPDQRPILPVPYVTVIAISIMALIHLFGIRLVALLNDAGVLMEILGTAAVTLILFVFYGLWRMDGWAILTTRTNVAGVPAGLNGLAASLLVGAWTLTGFEGAADLAEETHRPKEIVPRAVLLSITSSGIGGFLMIASFLLAIPDLVAAQASDRPLLDLFEHRLGSWLMPVVMLVVFIAIFACGMASMAAATRLVFALARDNMLPFSGWLKQVHPTHQTPRNAILAVWALSMIVVVVLERTEIISSVATVTGYLGYLGIVIGAFWCREAADPESSFSLGRLRVPIACLATAWTISAVLALLLADSEAGSRPAIASAIAVGAGFVLYVLLIAGRIRAGDAGPPKLASQPDGLKS